MKICLFLHVSESPIYSVHAKMFHGKVKSLGLSSDQPYIDVCSLSSLIAL
jgi:hypothetical protein